MPDETQALAVAETTAMARIDPEDLARTLLLSQRPLADKSVKSYRRVWSEFCGWCGTKGLRPCPTEDLTLSLYLQSLAKEGDGYWTLHWKANIIKAMHSRNGFALPPLPITSGTLLNFKRKLGDAKEKKKPLLVTHLQTVSAKLAAGDLRERRDLAIVLVGWASASRRSEVHMLDVSDVAFEPEGILLQIGGLDSKGQQRTTKTDQTGKGRKVAIPKGEGVMCPVRALQTWLKDSKIKDGPLWRPVYGPTATSRRLGYEEINQVIKEIARMLGFDPKKWGGHSLRSGFMTSGAMAHKELYELMATSGHKSVNTAMGYIQAVEGRLFDQAAAGDLLREPPEAAQARKLLAKGYSPEQVARGLAKTSGRSITAVQVRAWGAKPAL